MISITLVSDLLAYSNEFILSTLLWIGKFYPYFIEEELEVQGDQVTFPGTHRKTVA